MSSRNWNFKNVQKENNNKVVAGFNNSAQTVCHPIKISMLKAKLTLL